MPTTCRLEARLYSDADPFIAQTKGLIESFSGRSFSGRSDAGKMHILTCIALLVCLQFVCVVHSP